MDSIFAIAYGSGLRFVLDTVTRGNYKVSGVLMGLWEGVVMYHFMRQAPRSTDPYLAYAVRVFIDFLMTESTFKIFLVFMWTLVGAVLADVAPILWRETGLKRAWHGVRRDLFLMTNFISVPSLPKQRTVRFSSAHTGSSAVSSMHSSKSPPAPYVAPGRRLVALDLPGRFPGDTFSETDTDRASVADLDTIRSLSTPVRRAPVDDDDDGLYESSVTNTPNPDSNPDVLLTPRAREALLKQHAPGILRPSASPLGPLAPKPLFPESSDDESSWEHIDKAEAPSPRSASLADRAESLSRHSAASHTPHVESRTLPYEPESYDGSLHTAQDNDAYLPIPPPLGLPLATFADDAGSAGLLPAGDDARDVPHDTHNTPKIHQQTPVSMPEEPIANIPARESIADAPWVRTRKASSDFTVVTPPFEAPKTIRPVVRPAEPTSEPIAQAPWVVGDTSRRDNAPVPQPVLPPASVPPTPVIRKTWGKVEKTASVLSEDIPPFLPPPSSRPVPVARAEPTVEPLASAPWLSSGSHSRARRRSQSPHKRPKSVPVQPEHDAASAVAPLPQSAPTGSRAPSVPPTKASAPPSRASSVVRAKASAPPSRPSSAGPVTVAGPSSHPAPVAAPNPSTSSTKTPSVVAPETSASSTRAPSVPQPKSVVASERAESVAPPELVAPKPATPPKSTAGPEAALPVAPPKSAVASSERASSVVPSVHTKSVVATELAAPSQKVEAGPAVPVEPVAPVEKTESVVSLAQSVWGRFTARSAAAPPVVPVTDELSRPQQRKAASERAPSVAPSERVPPVTKARTSFTPGQRPSVFSDSRLTTPEPESPMEPATPVTPVGKAQLVLELTRAIHRGGVGTKQREATKDRMVAEIDSAYKATGEGDKQRDKLTFTSAVSPDDAMRHLEAKVAVLVVDAVLNRAPKVTQLQFTVAKGPKGAAIKRRLISDLAGLHLSFTEDPNNARVVNITIPSAPL